MKSTNHLCYCSRQMTMTTSDLRQNDDICALCAHRGGFHLLLCTLESIKVAAQEQSTMYLSHILKSSSEVYFRQQDKVRLIVQDFVNARLN